MQLKDRIATRPASATILIILSLVAALIDFSFSCNGLRAGRLPCLHYIDERPDRNSTNRPRKFPAAAAIPKQTGFGSSV
jgi:hypothetical protein